jgi:hypothetical protein
MTTTTPNNDDEAGMSARLARRLAWFAIDVAVDSGFTLRAPEDGGSFEATQPPDVSDEIAGPIIAALIAREPEVVGFLRFLDSEERQGRRWRPGARGVPQ